MGTPGPLDLAPLGQSHRSVSIPPFCQVTSPWRSKRGRPPLWLRRENLGQGLGFCRFRPGNLQPHGNIHVSSARPPIVFFWFLVGVSWRNQSGDRVRGRSWASHPAKSRLRRLSVLLTLFVRVPEQSGSGGTRPPIPPKGRGPRSSSVPSLAG